MMSSPLFRVIDNFIEEVPSSMGSTVHSVPKHMQATLDLLLNLVLCWQTNLDSAELFMVLLYSRRAN